MFSIVIVTFNSASVIAECLGSIPEGSQVIVVDNASQDTSADIAERLGAQVIRNSTNEGFGRACNRGAATARHAALLFLNPDARLQAGALEQLASAMERYPQAAAFNPRLIDADGHESVRGDNVLIDKSSWFDGPARGDREIPMAVGAALLIRKLVFDRLGGFDENIFLFYEDDDLSARVHKAGHNIVHVHEALCVHLCERSTLPSEKLSDFKDYHYFKSRLYVLRKHGVKHSLRLMSLRYRLKLVFFTFLGKKAQLARLKARLRAVTEAMET